MINMSDTFKSKIYSSERYLEANALINNVDYRTDILKDFNYNSSITSNSFTIGSTNASTFEITLNKLVETIEENQEVKPYIGIIGAESIPLGVFYIKEIKRDRNAKTTKIKCQDKMMYLNELYKTNLAFPAKIRDVIQDISEKVKMEFVPTHISYNKEVQKLEKVSYREMLSYLAQIEGCFVVFDRYGKLEFRKFNRTQEKITKNNYFLSGLEVNDVEYKLNGITADLKNKEKTILASGSAVGNQINLVNPLMKQDYLDEVYTYLKQFIFKPYTVNWQGNPALEVGDFVQVEVADGNYIGVPILNLQLNFSGGLNCKMSADVKTSTSTSYEYKGTLQKQIEFLNARIGADGTTIYADTKEPTNPKEGDTWFKPNGAYTDLYIYEKGKWVLKVSTGNFQELVTKITTDEVLAPKLSAGIAKIIELDASRITTGFLDADRIKANSITSDKLTVKAKEELINGLVTETKYTELVADNTEFKSKIGQILTEKFDNLQIGARNLARNSQNFDKNYWVNLGAEKKIIEHLESWNGFDSVEFKGVNPNKNSRVSGIYDLAKVFEIEFKQGQNYTVSFDAINLSEIPFKFLLNGFDKYNKIELKANEQKRIILNGIKNYKNYSRIAVLVDELGQDVKFSIKNIKITKDLSDIILEKVPIDMNLWKSWRASQKLIGKILKKSDWDGVDSVEFKGVYATENIGDDGLVGFYRLHENHTHKIEFKQGQIYTVSFDAINLSEIPFKFCLNGFEKYNKIELKANEQKRVVLNGIKNDENYLSQISVLIDEALVEKILINQLKIDIKFKVKKLKIEEGNKATTWTPAVEDIEDIMKTSESKISNVVEKTTTLTQNQEMLLVKVNSKVDKNETEKWLKFSDDGLELGEKNGNMKLRISNNKISYINNDVEESFWNNKSFYVKSSLKIGEFDVVPETDGSISLI